MQWQHHKKQKNNNYCKFDLKCFRIWLQLYGKNKTYHSFHTIYSYKMWLPIESFFIEKKSNSLFYLRKTKSWSISRFIQSFLDLSGQILENNTHIHIINLSIECVMHMHKYTYAIQLNLLFYSNKISFKFFFVFFFVVSLY